MRRVSLFRFSDFISAVLENAVRFQRGKHGVEVLDGDWSKTENTVRFWSTFLSRGLELFGALSTTSGRRKATDFASEPNSSRTHAGRHDTNCFAAPYRVRTRSRCDFIS
jgi:hypothetical protein